MANWHLVETDGYPTIKGDHEYRICVRHPVGLLGANDDGLIFFYMDGFDGESFYAYFETDGIECERCCYDRDVIAWIDLKEVDQQCKDLILGTAIADVLNSCMCGDVCQNEKEE